MLKNGKNLRCYTMDGEVESKVIPITDNTVETRITANGEVYTYKNFRLNMRKRRN